MSVTCIICYDIDTSHNIVGKPYQNENVRLAKPKLFEHITYVICFKL